MNKGLSVPIKPMHFQCIVVYFIANRENQKVRAECTFRIEEGKPELWDPLSGDIRQLPEFIWEECCTKISLQFEAYQSFFVVFRRKEIALETSNSLVKNFPEETTVAKIEGSWNVSFDPKWGGPISVTFQKLEDWTNRPEEGIRYYSGIATYSKIFDLPKDLSIKEWKNLYIDLGQIHNMASVRLNGTDVGIAWTAPWRVNIADAVKETGNHLEIEVANLWPNRLIGDEQYPDDGMRDGKWPAWLLKGELRTSGRYTFTTKKYYKKDSPLLKSGLIGPVTIVGESSLSKTVPKVD